MVQKYKTSGKSLSKGRTPTKKKVKLSEGYYVIEVRNGNVYILRHTDKKPESVRRQIGW